MMKLVVLSCLLVAASASAPWAYAGPFPYNSLSLIAPYNSNYRGPLSLAPGQPANILAADGRPLDTLDVNLDRAAHLTAKAFDGFHILKKRSVALATPFSRIAYTAPLYAPSAHLAYSAPIAHYAPYAPITYAAAPLAHALY